MSQKKRESGLPAHLAKYPTPFHVFHADRLREDAGALAAGLRSKLPRVKLHYSTKTNSLLALLRILLADGWGLEVVSTGDRRQASLAGAKGDQLVLNGAAWTRTDLEDALVEQRVRHVTVDSPPMAELLGAVVRDHAEKLRGLSVALRIHEGHSHFGVPARPDALGRALAAIPAPEIGAFGLHLHANPGGSIASPAEAAGDFRARARALLAAARMLPAAFREKMSFVDLGGGLDSPFVYRPPAPELGGFHDPRTAGAARARSRARSLTLEQLGRAVSEAVAGELEHAGAWTVFFEPGRSVCSRALSTVIEVRSVKERFYPDGDVVLTDGNTAILGPLHRGVHPVELASREGAEERPAFVYGNLPHSGDWLFQAVSLPRLEIGDRLLISHTGAYFLPLEANFGQPRPGIFDFARDVVLRAPETEIDPGIRDSV